MSSIAEKLAAAKQAAVASSGIQGAAAAAAPATKSIISAPQQQRATISAIRPEDLIPRKTSKDEVLFKSTRANLGFIIAPNHKEVRKFRFLNHYFLTKDPSVIEYVRANAAAFGVTEVDSPVQTTEETKQNPEQK